MATPITLKEGLNERRSNANVCDNWGKSCFLKTSGEAKTRAALEAYREFHAKTPKLGGVSIMAKSYEPSTSSSA